MKREDKWGEDTSRSRKMGGVYLSEGKSGGSILKRRKKWGEYTKVKKKMGGVHICGQRPRRYEHPPSGCFWHLPLMLHFNEPFRTWYNVEIFLDVINYLN